MDVLTLMKRFGDKLRAAEKELARLEKRAKTLAEKHATVEAERESIEGQIYVREMAREAAQGAMEELFAEWSRAAFEGDTAAQAEVQGKRTQLQQEIDGHTEAIRSLQARKAELADHSREVAEIYVAIEGLRFGAAYNFATRLRTELVNNEVKLGSRQQAARQMLPKVDLAVLEAVRADTDEEYLEKKQKRELELEAARQYRARNEQELRKKASTPYRGAGQGGKPRAMTQAEATEKIRATRGQ